MCTAFVRAHLVMRRSSRMQKRRYIVRRKAEETLEMEFYMRAEIFM